MSPQTSSDARLVARLFQHVSTVPQNGGGMQCTYNKQGYLSHLFLSNLSLTHIPGELSQLSRLQRLDLSRNYLTSIPTELGQLPHLQILELADNPNLHNPPPDVVAAGDKASLAYLRRFPIQG